MSGVLTGTASLRVAPGEKVVAETFGEKRTESSRKKEGCQLVDLFSLADAQVERG